MTPTRRDLLRLLATMPAAITLAACRSTSPAETDGADGTDGTVTGSSAGPTTTTDPTNSTTGSSTGPSTSAPDAHRVPEPLAMIRTSWSADPWARGSYSYLPVGAQPALRAALAQPIDGRLFIAGEATSGTAPATVHGALASGRRAADEVAAVADTKEVVAVLGAGMAGLAAARALLDEGYSVVVFEARDRIGGRVATVRSDAWPIPVELGASWVHDIAASDLATQLHNLAIDTAKFDYDDDTTLFTGGLPTTPKPTCRSLRPSPPVAPR